MSLRESGLKSVAMNLFPDTTKKVEELRGLLGLPTKTAAVVQALNITKLLVEFFRNNANTVIRVTDTSGNVQDFTITGI